MKPAVVAGLLNAIDSRLPDSDPVHIYANLRGGDTREIAVTPIGTFLAANNEVIVCWSYWRRSRSTSVF